MTGLSWRRLRCGDAFLGDATLVSDTLYQYTFATGQLAEGDNAIVARTFDGIAESADSPSLNIALDTIGPRVVQHVVDSAGQQPVSHVDLVLSEQVWMGSISLSSMPMTGPNGPIPIIDVADQGGSDVRVRFPTQLDDGDCHLVFGDSVVDFCGNPIEQDLDEFPGEAPDDLYDASFTLAGVHGDLCLPRTSRMLPWLQPIVSLWLRFLCFRRSRYAVAGRHSGSDLVESQGPRCTTRAMHRQNSEILCTKLT